MNRLIGLTVAMLVMAGCSDEKKGPDGPAAEGKINLSTTISALTRTPQLGGDGSGNFSAGDVLTLTVSDGSATHSLDYTYGTTQLWWEDLNLNASVSSVTFAGCYPRTDAPSGTFAFDITKAAGKDLLLAPAVTVRYGSEQSVALVFEHATSKLSFVVTSSDKTYTDEELKGFTVTLTAKTTCTVDLKSGILTSEAATGSGSFTASASEASVLLVPQAAGDVALTVTLEEKSCELKLSEMTADGKPLTALEGGKAYTVTLDAKKDGISFGGMSISGWENGGKIEGDIEL